MTTTATRRRIRVPSARVPRQDRRFGAGVVAAAGVHAVLLVWMLFGAPGLGEYRRGIGTPGVLGGGGGGGGGGPEIHYITLPLLPRSARSATPPPARVEIPTVVEERVPEVPVEVPVPVVVATEPAPAVAAVTRPTRVEAVDVPGRDAGNGGGGPGTGGGTGGGIGTGRGTGIGSGEGPGTGGDSGDVIAPRERAIVFPFEQAPPSSQGVTYTIRFYVNERGRPTRIEIEPEIADKDFRKKVMERMREWTFYPARTLEGRNVKGQYVTTYTP